MRILTIHNRYQHRGGEDEVHDAEEQLLRSRGHDIRPLIFDNAGIGGFAALRTGLSTPWSQASYRRAAREIASWHPDVVSVHNFFPLASPAVYYAASRAGVPVVQTLHNYRILCPAAVLFRDGRPCEDCFGKVVPWPGIVRACYRESYSASAAVASMIGVHNLLRTWDRRVSLFFVLTEFARQKFIQGGLPAKRLAVKPNFVPIDLGPGRGDGDFVLYAGRLSEEKGISSLLSAWQTAKPRGRLLLAGDGPLTPVVQRLAERDGSIQYLGRLSMEDTCARIGNARACVFPSLMYEGMPRMIIEAFSRGIPVIANRSGSMIEMIRDEETGWLVEPGDCSALAGTLSAVFSNQGDQTRMRSAARTEFERNYTADRQYERLMDAYQHVVESSTPRPGVQ